MTCKNNHHKSGTPGSILTKLSTHIIWLIYLLSKQNILHRKDTPSTSNGERENRVIKYYVKKSKTTDIYVNFIVLCGQFHEQLCFKINCNYLIKQ